jgi:hypothetical protein
MFRALSILLLGLAVAGIFTAPALAAGAHKPTHAAAATKSTYEGTIQSAMAGKLVFTVKGETSDHTWTVAQGVKVKLNGKAAKLEDLKKGFVAKVIVQKDGSNMQVIEVDAKNA